MSLELLKSLVRRIETKRDVPLMREVSSLPNGNVIEIATFPTQTEYKAYLRVKELQSEKKAETAIGPPTHDIGTMGIVAGIGALFGWVVGKGKL